MCKCLFKCITVKYYILIQYLDCWAGNEKLRTFYLKAGFDFCGDFPEDNYMSSVFKYE
ncbi:hypothetical protein SH2C18_35360 [Clostridium sediminicola]